MKKIMTFVILLLLLCPRLTCFAVENTEVPAGNFFPSEDTGFFSLTNEDVASAVDTALDSSGLTSMADLGETQQESFLNAVNERLEQITGSGEDVFTSMKELKAAYVSAVREVYVASVLSGVDPADVETIMKTALKIAGTQELKNAAEHNTAAFLSAFTKKIAKRSPDVYDVEEKLSTEDMLKAVQDNSGRL